MSELSLKSEDNESLEAVERYLADIAAHSAKSSDFAGFATGLLKKTLVILNAQGGAIWVCGTPPDLHLQYHCNLELTSTDGVFLENHQHTGFLQGVLQAGKPQVATPEVAGSPRHTGDSKFKTNESSHYWIACPLTFRNEVIGIIEVFQTASSNEDLIQGNIKLLTMAADLTAEFLRQQQLHEMQESDLRWQQYENLVHQLNSDLDLTRTAFQIVNGCRCYLDCDRFTLLLPKSKRLRTFAISGTETFDRGSQQLQKLELLSEAVMLSKKSLRFRGDLESLPPQLEKPLNDYVDQSHANGIDVIPLLSKADTGAIQQPLGVLVIESFQGHLTPTRELMIPRVANLADMT
ncbi:MAG: GAF domain-containing protein, partial [Pirellulales bacterium]